MEEKHSRQGETKEDGADSTVVQRHHKWGKQVRGTTGKDSVSKKDTGALHSSLGSQSERAGGVRVGGRKEGMWCWLVD